MTSIRDIGCEDVPLLLDGAREFWKAGELPGVLQPDRFVNGWRRLLLAGNGILIGAYQNGGLAGAIGGAVAEDFPTGQAVANELFWFCREGTRGAGVRLLKAFEERAAQLGAARVCMVHLATLNDERMETLYGRMGYALREKLYFKNVTTKGTP